MTVAEFNHPGPGNTQSLATFKAWALGIHDMLIAVGFIQTSDTGQADLDAVEALPAADTSAGYRVYEMNDSLSSTRPIYLKVEYRVGQSSTAEPYMQVGLETDGAGTIVKQIGLNVGAYNAGTTGAGAANSIASRGEGYFWIWLFKDIGVNEAVGCLLYFERALDNVGNYRSDAAMIGGATASLFTANPPPGATTRFTHFVNLDTLIKSDSNSDLQLPSFFATGTLTIGVVPMFFYPIAYAPGVAPWQPTVIGAVPPSLNPSVPFEVSVMGEERTYFMPTYHTSNGLGNSSSVVFNSNTLVNNAIALLYEVD